MNRKGLVGLAKLGSLLAFLFLIVAFAGMYLSSVSAAGPPGVNIYTPILTAPSSNSLISLNISNTNTSVNVSQINITFPTVNEVSGNGQFTLIANNQIIVNNVSLVTFTNTSGESAILTWSNTTNGIFNASSVNVSFNVSLPDWPGSYNFNITVLYNDSSVNSTNVTINVTQPVMPGTLPGAWADNASQPSFFWVNISNDVDFFYFNGMQVVMAVNFTSPVLGVGVPGLNITGNFSSIGNSSSVSATDQGSGLYQFNVTTNYSAISGGVSMMGAGLINLTVRNGTGNVTLPAGGGASPVILVNMSTMPSCPPANDPNAQLPSTMDWDNGTLFQTWNVLTCQPSTNSTCNNEPGPAQWNSTHILLCGPVWGASTTNFSAVAANTTGNFSNIPLVLEIPGKAMINFTQGVDFAGQNGQRAGAIMEFAMKNLMGAGKFGINDSEWDGSNVSGRYKPNMNITATLTLYNVSGQLGITDGFIRRGSFNGSNDPNDLVTCPPSICDPTKISFDGENITFQVGHFSTLVVGNTTHTLNFINTTSGNQTVVINHNTTYNVTITNNGNATQERYNLSVINATNASALLPSGLNTTLNVTSITLNQSNSTAVMLTVASNTTGVFDLAIQATHYNDTGGNDDIILNSSDAPDNLSFVTTGNDHEIIITNPAANISTNLNVQVNFTNTSILSWCLAVDINGTNVTTNQTDCKSGDITINLSEGPNQNITLYVNDTLGHIFSNITNFTSDVTTPNVTSLNAPANNSNETSSNVTFNWTVTDNIDALLRCNVTIDGTVNQTNVASANNTATNLTVTGLSDGSHNWSMTCRDDSGNSNTSNTLNFDVDTIPPNVTINSPADSSYVNGVIVVNATVADGGEGVDTVQFNVSNSTFSNLTTMTANGSSSFYNANLNTSALLDGASYNITIIANDTVNNVNNTESVSITVDNTAPSLSNWTYNFVTKQLTLNFNDIMSINSVNLGSFNITYSSGATPSELNGLNNTGLTVLATTTNSSTIIINLTEVEDNAINNLGTGAEIDMLAGAVTDRAGNNVATATDLTITSYTQYTIVIPTKGYWGTSTWNPFNLPLTILQAASSLSSNYTVTNVLASVSGNYAMIYYYNSSAWTSYVPGRPSNDFVNFTADNDNHRYWINVTTQDRLEIV